MYVIKYVHGDLVKNVKSNNRLSAYAHQCNCFCRMGRGIAPQLARLVPELRQADDKTVPADRGKLGTVTYADFKDSRVFNVYSQYHWNKYPVAPDGRLTEYIALHAGLKKVREYLLNKPTHKQTLGIPLIGCGLAKGKWGDVLKIINAVFENTDIQITVFILEKEKFDLITGQ